MNEHIDIAESAEKKDKGFTLVELLIVIVILGILATVTVFAVRGVTDKGQKNACGADKAKLQTATEAYFANYGNTIGIATATYASTAATGNTAVTTPVAVPAGQAWTQGATPADSLVNAGLLRSKSANIFVKSDGSLVYVNTTCGGVVGGAAG